MGITFLTIALILFIRHKPDLLPAICSLSAIFFIFAFTLPLLLKPIYILWMRLAFILGWFNTRLLLLIMFYLIFAPIGLIMRLLRIDLLDRRIDKNRHSYWREKEEKSFDPLNYKKQF
jgi:hypothetical protein